ncbi:hypothetical protein DEJ49_33680 [Streptomyces venezuelae]|uniref:Uncharacterized protein n=1 Tax=Streptomyces venezuelae TaxID=54571 RepID=A0A5P2CVZ6_STRVZ|nr:hypothetical protein DEJ49_33680 [Streptomyces venezuelae]
MSAGCRGCEDPVDEPVPVALEHSNSAGGRLVRMCTACRQRFQMIPLDEHPPDSPGFPIFATPPRA